MVVRDDRLAEESFDNGSAEFVRKLYDFIASAERALPDQNHWLLRFVEQESGHLQFVFARNGERWRPLARCVPRDLVHRAFAGRLDLLIVNWKSNVRDASVIERVAARFVRKHSDLIRIDDLLVID